ncbi:MAG TPA: DNA polymerase III subunit alpha [Cyanobacteria bacterium UBA10660]|mgnify:FL=1|nr:MAG TPA: DNA polymerase III subunit alpha [Candidatus Gastranaerophilales bacterium HUM_1]HAS93766.1 DNA polymerase III subunit alpha [Cyanobacteria bacterium UBA10660]
MVDVNQEYVPLHLHTEYSLLDGAIRIGDLVKFCAENNMPGVAVTDHGVMYGAMDLYIDADKNNSKEREKAEQDPNYKPKLVNPIVGCEFYVHDGDISERNPSHNPRYHLVLLVKNNQGYKNIVKLASKAHIEGFYMKPRINWELLEQYHEGLICSSACLGGEVLQNLLKGDYEKAKATAKRFKDLFGEDYYIELQDHGLEEQKRTNPDLIRIAKELDIKMIITNDSHYLKKEDADWHDTLLCMQTKSSKSDTNRFHFPNNEFYVKTVSELRDSFKWLDSETFDECIKNTVEISKKCHITVEWKAPLPDFPVPEGFTTDTYLEKLVYQGIRRKYHQEEIDPKLQERAKYELGVIEQMGFSAYFLITWDFIHYAKTHDIPVGPGRGSAAGSLVAYALDITDLDPIEHNLLFERFLNPERFSMPDIDTDFCIEKRGKVIDYVVEKYGADKVCQIITFNTLAARNAMKSVARVFDIPYARSKQLSDLISGDPGAKISDSLQDGMELKTLYDSDPEVKRLVDTALHVEGLKNATGMHAAGVIISYKPLDEIVPVQHGKDGVVVTQYHREILEKMKLLKMDFLGLRNLTMISKTVKLIKKCQGIDLDINHIPLDDKPTYDMLIRGETVGVFQLESQGMTNLVKKLQPDVFEDLGALVALFRPGPLGSGMVDVFVDRKHGRQEITYPHPRLEKVLKDTYGTMVYQEQIMQIFQEMADYSLGQADMVRRMMGHKDPAAMAAQEDKLIEGSAKYGMKAEDAKTLFEQIQNFASYCFNRAHSSAYAFVAYQTAFLKCHYPVEYLSSLLSSVAGDQEKTQAYIEEALKYGIKVLPPDINKSYLEYAPDGKNIRFGLASIKQVGEGVIEEIIKEREANGDFKSIYDFIKRVDVKCANKRALEGLIKAGAFSTIEKSRKQLMENLEYITSTASKEAKEKESGQGSLFDMLGDTASVEDAKFHLSGSDEEYDARQIQIFEKEFLGFYVTSHPLSTIRDKLPFLMTHKISQIPDIPNDKVVTICGLVTATKQIPTRNDPTKFVRFVTIEDLTGKIDTLAFNSKIAEYNDFLQNEQRIIVSGKVSRRSDDDPPIILVDTVKPVDNSNIFTIELKDELKFEELMLMKQMLCKFSGSDPVMLKLPDLTGDVKILASSMFWVNSSNDLVNMLNKRFGERIGISIKSMDTNLKEPV